MLIDNINFLIKHNRPLREFLKNLDNDPTSELIKIIDSKVGDPTVEVTLDSQSNFIHSKYNPIQEAERFIEQYSDKVDNYDSVLFYGIGLGYHVEAFLNKYKNLNFSLYEPNPIIFKHFMSVKSITSLPINRMKHFHVERDIAERAGFLNKFANQLEKKVLLVILPSYDRIFKEQCRAFVNKFKGIIQTNRQGLHVNLSFEKRWTVNSLSNCLYNLKTPNILEHMDLSYFKNKPALLVSSGPSLADEIENVRIIQEEKLAYIVAAGSSLNALLENDIYPDAVVSYDPTDSNQKLCEKVIENKINTIPLIYGTSINYKTLQLYPGPKCHFITSQDTVLPYYTVNDGESAQLIYDTPSIAVITLQLLDKLQCNPIIFVGQNLAFKDDKFYSKGVRSVTRSEKLKEIDIKDAIEVECVGGNKILTNNSLNLFRLSIESYLKAVKNKKVINATKGGAKIEGAPFKPLENIIDQLETGVVTPAFKQGFNSQYSKSLIKERQEFLDQQFIELKNIISRLVNILLEMERFFELGQEKDLNNHFKKYDKEFKKLEKNQFYKMFLQPMLRVEFEITSKQIQSVRFDRDVMKKGNKILEGFTKYITNCQQELNKILPLYKQIRHQIPSIVNEENEEENVG